MSERPIGGKTETGQLLDYARTVLAEEDLALLVILKGGGSRWTASPP